MKDSTLRVLSEAAEGVSRFLNFLRRSEYAVDFSTPVWERKRKQSYATVRITCYSPEQALMLADECWNENRHRDGYTLFRIRVGDKVLKDYLEP